MPDVKRSVNIAITMKTPTDDKITYAIWTTALGTMAGVKNRQGLIKVILPFYRPDDLKQILTFNYPDAADTPDEFADLIRLSRDYFNGKEVSFLEIPCCLPDENTFTGKVLRKCRQIPYGQTRSYSQLAEAINRPNAARAVAATLGKNPLPLVIPCHRVIYANGNLGGFSSPGGEKMKRKMLSLEHAI
ncbi:MAG: methylated-DNA--[protein]-cysteine S-methyltransferase [Planctomycetes bacterium]|nr:methylated-DNA--[protein]-cysteine S-methyltransferase [Planctomycetota bacterium]